MSKAGRPGALASSADEGADVTDQRVSAALATGSPSIRSNIVVTPDLSAASFIRLLAVRSSLGIFPQPSITTAPNPPQRTASTAARNKLSTSGAITNNIRPGSRPSSNNPDACSPPPSFSPRSCRNQKTASCAPQARLASMAAKPDALAPSSAAPA